MIAAPPGTGKSTVLKHILPREKTLYLLRTDLVVFDFSRLNQMKVDVLVIEDINDISWRSGDLSKVFNCICNAHEQALKNKHGQPIRIIITSNNNEIDIATANRYDHNFKALVPRMVSRFSSRFHTLKLEPTYTDLRAKQSSSRIHFVRSIESQKQSLSDGYLNVKKFYDTLLVFSASQAYSEQGKYRREFNLNASQRSHVTVDFSALSLRSINNFNFIKNEFFRLIDLMEDKLKTLTCVHSDPEALYCKLQSIIEETFVNSTAEAQRYLSRLNNNACIESPLLSQSLS